MIIRLLLILSCLGVFLVACGGEGEPEGPVDLNVVPTEAPTATLDPGPGRTRIALATAEAEAVVAVTEAAPTFTPSPTSTPAGSHGGGAPVFRRTPLPPGGSVPPVPTIEAGPTLEVEQQPVPEVPTPAASATPDPTALVRRENAGFLFSVEVPRNWRNVSVDPMVVDYVEPDGLAGVFVRIHPLTASLTFEALPGRVHAERSASWAEYGIPESVGFDQSILPDFHQVVFNRARRAPESCRAQFRTGFYRSAYPERSSAYEGSFWVCEGSELTFDGFLIPIVSSFQELPE